MNIRFLPMGAGAAALLLASVLVAPASAASEPAAMPQCNYKIGAVTVREPQDNNRWWLEYDLQSPAALIKFYVSRSGCFTLVDRGKGLKSARAERALSASGDLRYGANIGKGQMMAADYVLVPDLISGNRDAGGNKIGGLIGGLIGGHAGAIIGGVDLQRQSADVLLTLTDIRSTAQVAMAQGHARNTDVSWAGGGGAFVGALVAAGASGYANTQIGQVIAQAYLDAYSNMVHRLQANAPDPEADNVQQAVRVTDPMTLYSEANLNSAVVRTLDPGMMLYPTGDKMGVWWKVTDPMGHYGWVLSTKLKLAH